MSVQIIYCEQGSPEWFLERLGLPTASEFDKLLAKGKGGGESKGRRTYMLKLIGERLTGEPADNYTNHHMERGKVMEDEARNAYAFLQDADPVKVGFIRNGKTGCSPDSLIGNDGLIEIKTKLPHLHLDVILANVVPPEHTAQIQGQLWVAEREWCDFVSYWPKLPLYVKRVHRDEAYIKTLKAALKTFVQEMDELQARITGETPKQRKSKEAA